MQIRLLSPKGSEFTVLCQSTVPPVACNKRILYHFEYESIGGGCTRETIGLSTWGLLNWIEVGEERERESGEANQHQRLPVVSSLELFISENALSNVGIH